MEIEFRKLRPEDSQSYRTIRLECLKNFPDNFGATYEEQSVLPKLAWEEFIEQQSPDKFTVGAFDGDALIGICSVNLETRKKTRHMGEIVQMYVKPEYAGQKVGLRLLQAAINKAFEYPHVEQLTLNVLTTNVAANRIYEKAGFTEYGLLKRNFKTESGYMDQRQMILFKDGLP